MPEDRKIEKASAGALLLATRRAQRDLRDAADDVIDDAIVDASRSRVIKRSTAYAAIMSSAKLMAPALVGALVLSHSQIANLARGRLIAEFGATGLVLHPSQLSGTGPLEEDRTMSESAALSLAAQWRASALSRVSQAIAQEKSVSRALETTRKALSTSLDRTSITEATRAYEDIRRRELVDLIETDKRVSKWVDDNAIVERWCAMVDACSDCEDLDGEECEIGGDFPGGARPPLHCHCQCNTSIVMAATMKREAA
jgi:hypothetical protein